MFDNVKNMLRSFKYRNYRLFFFGQGLSLVGTWIQQVALGWLAYKITGSPFMLALVAFATQAPQFVIAPFAGVLSDRFDKRKIIIAADIGAMIQASALAALVLTHTIQPWHIIALAVFLGISNGFEMPTRHSFIPDIVEKKEDLVNAIPLNSAMFNSARLIGPPIAGLVVAAMGEGFCFLLNALSYATIIIALLMMNVKPKQQIIIHKKPLVELYDGFRYVMKFRPLRDILLLMTMISLFGSSCVVFLPVFAKDILGGGPKILGLLMAAMGAGALIGAIFLAGRKSVRGLGSLIVISLMMFGTGLVLTAYSRILWLSLAMLVVAGFGMMAHMAASNTLLQTITDDDKRGRVMSFYIMAFSGLGPVGSLVMGWAAKTAGVPVTVAFGGVLTVISGVVFAFALPGIRELLRPVYISRGIIRESQEITVEESERIR